MNLAHVLQLIDNLNVFCQLHRMFANQILVSTEGNVCRNGAISIAIAPLVFMKETYVKNVSNSKNEANGCDGACKNFGTYGLSVTTFFNLINLTLYTPFQCTLPHTFTYRACPFSVHCLPNSF